jgi:hypothetical protein
MPSLSNRISNEYYRLKKQVSIEIRKGTFLIILPASAGVSFIRESRQIEG